MKVQKFSCDDVEIVEKNVMSDGFFKLKEYRVKHKLFRGGWSPTLSREILERGHAVAVLPYDPVLNEFVMVQQFRTGAMATCDNPWLIEIIAGMIEPEEAREDVCIREAKEEAGIDIQDLHFALSYLSSPGGTTERIHIYMARVDTSQAEGVHGLDSEHEDILVMRVPEIDAMAMLREGKIDNAASVIALQWFALNKESLLKQWSDNR
ncbi:ADP-ribose diphosphatase [Aestuariibacter sp. AA17]|uniref:ADP-ribose pyrophosphatase n=1 Tax=Fluctibacter corallii TaxID=2984329 RepID=A0ABT3A4J9_9ALTE|nr:ADP-ribose diphosphatase [Aestuariibacter sp. AA17]MCV2883600.1 ADP-ribose diphosphatase [Aestuariibacter sp. AA17]